MENIILIAVIVAILGCASRYIYKEKKRGVTCIGCPHSCSGSCGGCSGCGGESH